MIFDFGENEFIEIINFKLIFSYLVLQSPPFTNNNQGGEACLTITL